VCVWSGMNQHCMTVKACIRLTPTSSLRIKEGLEHSQSDVSIPVTVEVSTGVTIAELKDKVTPSWHGNKKTMHVELSTLYYSSVLLLLLLLLLLLYATFKLSRYATSSIFLTWSVLNHVWFRVTHARVLLSIFPRCTLQFSHDYGFNAALQRWVIGKRLAGDGETLYDHGIRQSGDQAFLFILSAQAHAQAQPRHLQQRQDEQQRLEGGFHPSRQPRYPLSHFRPR